MCVIKFQLEDITVKTIVTRQRGESTAPSVGRMLVFQFQRNARTNEVKRAIMGTLPFYAAGLGKRVQPRIMSYDGCGEVAHCGD